MLPQLTYSYVQPVYLPVAALTSFLAFSLLGTTINGI